MSAILTALVPALLPALSDGFRGLFAKLSGNAAARPQSVAEVIQLMQADTARLQALASLDQAGGVHAWVADIRALQRPVVVFLIIVGYLYALYAYDKLPPPTLDAITQYAQMITFYLFGDRSYSYLKGK